MAGLVVLSTGRSRRLPGTCLGWNPGWWGGAGPGLLIASLPVPGAAREGVWRSFARGQRTVLADVRKEKYDAREAAIDCVHLAT